MRNVFSGFLFSCLGVFLFSVPALGAITGLEVAPSKLLYVAPTGSTAIQTDTSPLIYASGSGSASLSISVSGNTSATTCGSVTWVTTTLASSTITGGGTAGVTLTVNPTCIVGIVSAQVTVTGGGFSVSLPVTLEIGISYAELSGMSPLSAPVGGVPFTLTVYGSGFANGGTGIQWNGTSLATTYVSATRVTALIPPSLIAVQGTANITVVNFAAPSSSAVNLVFTIGPLVPAIRQLAPDPATVSNGAYTLEVLGSGFIGGSIVEWNGTVLATQYANANELTATVPAGFIAAPGTPNVTVVNPGGAVSNTLAFAINPVGAALTGIRAASGTLFFNALTGSTQIQTASDLISATGTGVQGIEVEVMNGTTGSGGYCPSRTWLTASLTNPTADTISGGGTAGVTISVDPTCISGIVTGKVEVDTTDGFTIFIPVTLDCYTGSGTALISALGPESAAAGGGAFSLVVDGTGFVNGGSSVEWNGVPVPTSYVSSTQLSASISANLIAVEGHAWVAVFNSGAGASNPSYFMIYPPGTGITGLFALPPSVTYHAVPGGSIQTDNSPLIVAAGAGSALLTIAVTSPTLNLSCGPWLTATLSNSVINGLGLVGVAITVNPCGSGTLNGLITVSGGAFSTTISVTLNISSLAAHELEAKVNIGLGISLSATAGAPPQQHTIGFTVPSVPNPAQSPSFQLGTTLNNGTNWLTATANGDASDFTLTVDAAKLTPNNYSGYVTITGSEGTSPFMTTLTVTLQVFAPSTVVSSLSPNFELVGGTAFTMTVNGSGFQGGGSTVNWNGSPLTTNFVSATQLTAPVSANLIAALGTANISVTSGSNPSNALPFTIGPPPPTIATLTPGSAIAGGGAFTLTVNGSGFVNNASVIEWAGTALATTFVSSSQLTALVSASLISVEGSAVVIVLNSGTSPSNAATLPINSTAAPVISSLSPAGASAGGPAFILTVNGSGFGSGTSVEWNGSSVSTTFVNATQLTANVPASLIAAATSASISVLNSGGPSSGALLFTVTTVAINILTIPHFPDGGGWRAGILLVNNDVVPAAYAVSFHNDAGVAYTPPLALGATNGTIPAGGSTVIQTADSSATVTGGWAQISSAQAIGGTAVFRYEPWSQEAAVPLLTGGAMKLEIPYQVGDGLTLGVALANPSATQNASVTEIIRDLTGNQLAVRSFLLQALNHTSFLPVFPATAAGGGMVEYDSTVDIYGLGIRSAPQGSGLAFTSLDADLVQPASTETISHIADGGGWRSTIILVNTAVVPAPYSVKFWNDSGAVYTPPLASGSTSGTIPVGGTAIIATADSGSTSIEGWAVVTSAQSLGGTAVFRYDPWSQEAAVPLLPSGGVHLEIPYQIGNNLTLGIALANPSSTQAASITEIIRDQNGNQLSTRAFSLAPQDHTAFIPTYPSTVLGGGVAEYDSNITIYGLGIRSAPEGTGLAFTSVRAVYR